MRPHRILWFCQTFGDGWGAAYKLTKDFKNLHPEIGWSQIEGMRHVMVHGYYQIEKSIVISTIREDIDMLRDSVMKILLDYDS